MIVAFFISIYNITINKKRSCDMEAFLLTIDHIKLAVENVVKQYGVKRVMEQKPIFLKKLQELRIDL